LDVFDLIKRVKHIFLCIKPYLSLFFFLNLNFSLKIFSGRFKEVNLYVISHSGNEKVAGLSRLAGLRWPVYGGNFIKDPMGVWQGNELLAGLERVAGL